MYVGAFGVAHDVISIVRAARILRERGDTRFRFIIVGEGVKRPECEAEAKAAGLDNIEFRQPVPKSDVPSILVGADLLVACVTDSQSYQFGINLNKLYDYFAAGRPVVFSGTAAADPVQASQGGRSIAPENPEAMADALEGIANMTAEERRVLGRRVREYAEDHFDVRKLAGTLEGMLSEAVADQRAAARAYQIKAE
jgi:glycosyltransferase involved in cell wall biosynthesis